MVQNKSRNSEDLHGEFVNIKISYMHVIANTVLLGSVSRSAYLYIR